MTLVVTLSAIVSIKKIAFDSVTSPHKVLFRALFYLPLSSLEKVEIKGLIIHGFSLTSRTQKV
jgi:hypothetical protein